MGRGLNARGFSSSWRGPNGSRLPCPPSSRTASDSRGVLRGRVCRCALCDQRRRVPCCCGKIAYISTLPSSFQIKYIRIGL